MGLYDTVWLKCPKCNERNAFQSKGGECMLNSFDESNVPFNVLMNVNRHSPIECAKCGTLYEAAVDLKLHAESIRLTDVQPGDLQSIPGDELPVNDTTEW